MSGNGNARIDGQVCIVQLILQKKRGGNGQSTKTCIIRFIRFEGSKHMKRKIVLTFLLIICIFSTTSMAFGTVKIGFDGISNYKYCKHNNIAGSQFVGHLYAQE